MTAFQKSSQLMPANVMDSSISSYHASNYGAISVCVSLKFACLLNSPSIDSFNRFLMCSNQAVNRKDKCMFDKTDVLTNIVLIVTKKIKLICLFFFSYIVCERLCNLNPFSDKIFAFRLFISQICFNRIKSKLISILSVRCR